MYHHFLPRSYLREWCGSDHKFTRFSRDRRGAFSAKRYGPESVGGRQDLYALQSVPVSQKQSLELEEFQRIDENAVVPLRLLRNGGIPKDNKARLDWSTLVFSLILRAPEVIDAYGLEFETEWLNPLDELVEEDPGLSLAVDLVKAHYHDVEPFAARDYSKRSIVELLKESPEIPQISALEWEVIDFSSFGKPVMTSDCPVMTRRGSEFTLRSLALAIGPTKIFIAYAAHQDRAEMLKSRVEDLLEEYNGLVVSRAKDLVIAFDDTYRTEVETLMSSSWVPVDRQAPKKI
ncbi:DUF4238 domain-containing protein [Rhizobium leguminosarum bv. viciae]|uniref:DUF4238 domain-containing protein n=1 Tax=Rhizobium leguminosarum TaxID=384 RepID=UPI0014410189|nr:DUF4238 domain-containing protein [Rhizobium leguminosarum]NKK16972.1 DUF4238 domain-containing protein [Rhizobium leguminosarum bv. viciae]